MTTDAAPDEPMSLGPLPREWSAGATADQFLASAAGQDGVLPVTVRVFHPLEANTQYLLDRFGARRSGPLGRPQVHGLPDDLADGVCLLGFDEADDGTLTARIDLLRRAWDRDITLSARAVPVEAVDPLYEAMLALLSTVRPKGVTA